MELSPEVKDLYQSLLSKLNNFGNIIVEEKKTSFHSKNKSGFAGIHPRKDYFILNIVSDSPIRSPRVVRMGQVSKSRFHNEVKIERIEDIDEELIEWLKKAYNLMG